MADDLSNYLSSGKDRVSLSAEKLEMMGKEAAHLLIDKQVPLHQAVVKVASQVSDINAEQVKRVVEFANTAAYLAYHEKNKTAGAESSYPQFDLADPHRVLSSLRLNAKPVKTTSSDVTYSSEPEKRKVSNAKREAALEDLFLGENKERVKTAGRAFSYESGVSQIMDAKADLTSLKEHLEHSGETFDLKLKEAEAEYYDYVKRYIMDGGSFTDVMRAAMEVEPGHDKLGSVLVPVIQRLLVERVATAERLNGENDGLSKVAHRIVDDEHPLVTLFGAMMSLNDEVEKVATALKDVDDQLASVQKAIREEFFARG